MAGMNVVGRGTPRGRWYSTVLEHVGGEGGRLWDLCPLGWDVGYMFTFAWCCQDSGVDVVMYALLLLLLLEGSWEHVLFDIKQGKQSGKTS